MINLRLPNITAKDDRGKLEQIRSYLYQFAQDLNWALSNIDNEAAGVTKKVEATTEQKNAVEQAQATFSEVKSLIIKSADIVNAYYDEINRRLEGVYVAESDFGTYKRETALEMSATSDDIKLLFGNQQTIQSDVDGINGVLQSNEEGTTILGSDAWCKIGVLDYEKSGFPIYGMEIGQTNTKGTETALTKFAQYRSDGVHLYDQKGIEVATIINHKLKITNAEMINATITGGMTMGGYDIITSNGLAFKWRGRG